jgi:hypothetical protein
VRKPNRSLQLNFEHLEHRCVPTVLVVGTAARGPGAEVPDSSRAAVRDGRQGSGGDRRLLPTTASPTGAGPAARPAEAGKQEDATRPKSRRPKPGTARAATVRDDRDPAKGARAALLELGRDDRERDG